MKPASKAFLLTLLSIIALSACRQADDGNYVRLAGNVFIFNYREAVATYVISLQRLRRLAVLWTRAHDHHGPQLRIDVIAVIVDDAGLIRLQHLEGVC